MGLFSTIGKIVGNVVLPGIGGELLGSLGAEIDADRSRQQAKEANKDALKNQMELAKYTSGLEQENWQKRFDIENAYNDPSAMRDRLENAGINPNLVYGSLSPNMAANPHVGVHSGQLSAYQNTFDMSLRAKQQALDEMRVSNETKVADSQVVKNQAEATKARAEAKREGLQSEQQEFINKMMKVAVDIGYNPFVEEKINAEFERAMKVARYDLDKMFNQLNYDLNLDKFSHQQMMDLKQISIQMARLELDRQIGASQVQSNLAAAFMMTQEGMLKKATENGVWLDNGMKVVDLNYKQFNTYLDVVGKIMKNRLTEREATKVLHEIAGIDADIADKLVKRGQSVLRQIFTGGMFY